MSATSVQTKEKAELTVKQAVLHAMASAKDLYAGRGLVDLSLEEVEMSEDDRYWLVTLGFHLPSEKPASRLDEIMFRQIHGKTYERRYKLFKVDAQTGKVESMKIRAV